MGAGNKTKDAKGDLHTMENSILNLFPIDPAYMIIGLLIMVVVLLILVIIAFVKIGSLSRRYDYFMQGKDAESLEDVILDQIDEIRNLKAEDHVEPQFTGITAKGRNCKI